MNLNYLSGKHRTGIRIAAKACEASNSPNFWIGACLTRGGSVISAGWNFYKNFGWNHANRFPTRHAEMHAISGLEKEELIGASLYVVRLRSNGKFGLAKPCSSCYEVLKTLRLKNAWYTTNENKVKKLFG